MALYQRSTTAHSRHLAFGAKLRKQAGAAARVGHYFISGDVLVSDYSVAPHPFYSAYDSS
ncbi:hypothetical protein CONPUDRAFT_140298 [Coniophora puteana RWD-64-598 SS2]|uniref:Uncharacterized protein n=1 Tax=Coniophora puteana (strain RWD-64-598) TaxID=741705 RepID=A0A5M3M7Y7_CONPW|nr:uncharacterized protein CONPUDRAFT_140298 [Coniophora puteana RWD-64-598 SS2]EIW74905.1 hypothetical protein CONPUDRAFT_140298 [Coniophora puteana RWD-64-598 SS2]